MTPFRKIMMLMALGCIGLPSDRLFAQKPDGSGKGTNATRAQQPYVQESHNEIDAEGTLHFKSPLLISNGGSVPMAAFTFINSDFVTLKTMIDEKGNPIAFETTHDGNHFRYKLTLDPPLPPGASYTYNMEGSMKGLVRPVRKLTNVYQYYMRHSPNTGVPTLRIETYLLPQGAQLIATVPESMEVKEENGRIKVFHTETIPAGGNLITYFQYMLPVSQTGKKVD